MRKTGAEMNRAATPTLEAGGPNAVNLAPAEACGAAMSITELQMWPVPPLHDNPSLDYAQADEGTRAWLYSGAKPQSESGIREIVLFCVRQKLPNALSWLVLQCGVDKLYLRCDRLGSEDAQMIAGWLERFPCLIALDISSNDIGNEGAIELASALKANWTLTSLNVQSNDICALGIEAFADILKTNSTLTHLDAHGYMHLEGAFGDAGAAKFSDALKTNSTLTMLNISRNEIGVTGAAALADALRTNSKLINLRVGGNTFSDTGAVALADALKINSTLTNLDVANSEVGDIGAVAFAAALKTNSTLTRLNVSYQQIGNAGIAALADALKTNSTLTTLIYSEDNCDQQFADAALFDALRNNVTLTGLDEDSFPYPFEPVHRRLQVNKNAKPFVLPAAEAIMTLPTSWQSKLPAEVGALIVKEMIVRAPVEGDGVEGLRSLVIASDIVKQRHRDTTG